MPSEHAELDPKALSDWTTAIVNKTHFVDINNPPHGSEWDSILNPRRSKSGSIEIPQQYSQPAIHVHMPSRSPHRSPQFSHRYLTPLSPCTPTIKRRFEPILSSPILLEHESWAEFEME